MLTKRIIPCLDVLNNQVVKGTRFRNHRIVGDIMSLASYYSKAGADELVFYDITASGEGRSISSKWVSDVAGILSIPFTVAGGIRSLVQAKTLLNAGADKISLNSPALERPELINELCGELGSQCVVIGIDSQWINNDHYVHQYTGSETTTVNSRRTTREWIQEVQERGAGELVLNCMHADGTRTGYDVPQLQEMTALCHVPLIASGGAGCIDDFSEVFLKTSVSGALAASVFHEKTLTISEVKSALKALQIRVR